MAGIETTHLPVKAHLGPLEAEGDKKAPLWAHRKLEETGRLLSGSLWEPLGATGSWRRQEGSSLGANGSWRRQEGSSRAHRKLEETGRLLSGSHRKLEETGRLLSGSL